MVDERPVDEPAVSQRGELAPLVPIVVLAALALFLAWTLLQLHNERLLLQAEIGQLQATVAERDQALEAADQAATVAADAAAAVQVTLTRQLTGEQEHGLALSGTIEQQYEQIMTLRQSIEVAEARQRELAAQIEQTESDRRQLSERQTELTTRLDEREASLGQLAERVEKLQRQVSEGEALALRLRQMLGLPTPLGPAGGEPAPAERPTATAATLNEQVDSLTRRAAAVSGDLASAERLLRQRLDGLRQLAAAGQIKLTAAQALQAPMGQPVVGPISSPYGMRLSPFTNAPSFHGGVDLVVPTGTSVRATQAGEVTTAGLSSSYGYVVIVRHAGGFETLYAHNSRLLVKPGQRIERGQVVALSGNTGLSTGPHVHYEIRFQGHTIDPVPLLLRTASGSGR